MKYVVRARARKTPRRFFTALGISLVYLFSDVKISRRGKTFFSRQNPIIIAFLKLFYETRTRHDGSTYVLLKKHNRAFKETC